MGSLSTVERMWARKSASVRVGPTDGQMTSPLTTSELMMNHNVPWRTYSNCRRSILPGRRGRPWCCPLQGLDAGHLIGAQHALPAQRVVPRVGQAIGIKNWLVAEHWRGA